MAPKVITFCMLNPNLYRKSCMQVPSAYFLTDTFLMLHELMGSKLFRVGNGPFHIQAGLEAMKAKRCMGALRYLWRNARDAAHHPDVAAMKRILEDSPLQTARLRSHEPEPEEPQEDDESYEDSPVIDMASPPHEESDYDENVEEIGSSSGEPEMEHEGPEEQPDEARSEPSDDPDPEPISECGGYDTDEDSHGTLSASTLCLGDIPKPSDSQREGAWMGDFYHSYGRDGCDNNLGLPKKERSQECMDTLIHEILQSLHDEGKLSEFLGGDSTNVFCYRGFLPWGCKNLPQPALVLNYVCLNLRFSF